MFSKAFSFGVIILTAAAGVRSQAVGQSYKCGLLNLVATCQNYIANYNDAAGGQYIYTYQGLNYTGFNAGGPFANPPSITPVNVGATSSFIRAPAKAGANVLPVITAGTATSPRFVINQFYFACGKPGATYPISTQQGVKCTVRLAAYTQLANLVPVGAPSLFTFQFTPQVDAKGHTAMQYAKLTLANAPLTAQNLLYPSYAGIVFDARDANGNSVDLFLDAVSYTLAAQSLT